MTRRFGMLGVVTILAIGGCATVQTAQSKEPKAQSKIAAKIRGSASFYGKELHGNRTASGERFDMNKLTAAHRTLPLGTRLRVTNTRNGQSVIVRVNDRGPFHGRRVLDLSHAAASRIGMVRSGVAQVTAEIVK